MDADGDSSRGSSDNSDEDDTQDRPPSKAFTYKRLANSLDKSLDPSCYDNHNFGTTDFITDEKVFVDYLEPKKNTKTQEIQWSNKKAPNIGRQRAYDICPQAICRFFHLQSVWDQSPIHSK